MLPAISFESLTSGLSFKPFASAISTTKSHSSSVKKSEISSNLTLKNVRSVILFLKRYVNFEVNIFCKEVLFKGREVR